MQCWEGRRAMPEVRQDGRHVDAFDLLFPWCWTTSVTLNRFPYLVSITDCKPKHLSMQVANTPPTQAPTARCPGSAFEARLHGGSRTLAATPPETDKAGNDRHVDGARAWRSTLAVATSRSIYAPCMVGLAQFMRTRSHRASRTLGISPVEWCA